MFCSIRFEIFLFYWICKCWWPVNLVWSSESPSSSWHCFLPSSNEALCDSCQAVIFALVEGSQRYHTSPPTSIHTVLTTTVVPTIIQSATPAALHVTVKDLKKV